MSTALSWTELRSQPGGPRLAAGLPELWPLDGPGDSGCGVAGAIVLLLTIVAVIGPAYLGGETPRPRSGSLLALLPSLCLGFLVLAVFTAVASAGGREIVPREEAVTFPVSSTTDHLGALLLAPLNIAWVSQAWALLGITSYALGPERLLLYIAPVLLWLLAATALAQVVGWIAEGVRRGPYGIAIFRTVSCCCWSSAVGALVVTDRLTPLLDSSPTQPDPPDGPRRPGRPMGLWGDRGRRARR